MKILAFAASNSKNSINAKLVKYVASLFEGATVKMLDLNDFEMPIYGIDKEKEQGVPTLAYQFAQHIDESDLVLIAFAEHNGTYTAAFKNIFDWISRVPQRTAFGDKNMFLMATSPGVRGGTTVLEIAKNRFPFNGGKVLSTFSLPKFATFFDETQGVVEENYKQELLEKVVAITAEVQMVVNEF